LRSTHLDAPNPATTPTPNQVKRRNISLPSTCCGRGHQDGQRHARRPCLSSAHAGARSWRVYQHLGPLAGPSAQAGRPCLALNRTPPI
jgi:hypothetical protein